MCVISRSVAVKAVDLREVQGFPTIADPRVGYPLTPHLRWTSSEWVSRCLTSHSTLYRSFRGRFLQARWPNQQRQTTEGSQLATEIGHQSHHTSIILLPMTAVSVRQSSWSVCLSRSSARLHCAKMAEQIKMLFGVSAPGDTWNVVLDVGNWCPYRHGSHDLLLTSGTPPDISGMAEARD